MPLGIGLTLIFIAVPILELALLIKLGGWIGFWPTLGLIIFTAVVGTTVLRIQGLQTMHKAMQSMAEGAPPVLPMIEGALLLIAGAFLLTPGVITDTIGGILLVPPIRTMVARWIITYAMSNGQMTMRRYTSSSPFGDRSQRGETGHDRSDTKSQRRPSGPGPVIDGDFERVDEKTVDPNRRRD